MLLRPFPAFLVRSRYHAAYCIRQDVRVEVERRADKNEKGQFLYADTHEPIVGQYDLGHVAGHEHWRELEEAENEGLAQEDFNDRMNNPDYFQIEDPHGNHSHVHGQPTDGMENKFEDEMQYRDLEIKMEAGIVRNYNDPTRFEKEVMDEPNKVGEQSPAMETYTSGWDSLKDVPFRGDQQEKMQEQEDELEQEM